MTYSDTPTLIRTEAELRAAVDAGAEIEYTANGWQMDQVAAPRHNHPNSGGWILIDARDFLGVVGAPFLESPALLRAFYPVTPISPAGMNAFRNELPGREAREPTHDTTLRVLWGLLAAIVVAGVAGWVLL